MIAVWAFATSNVSHYRRNDNQMAETILMILGILYLVYRVAFGVSKDIRRVEQKVDGLRLHLDAIELQLSRLDKNLNPEGHASRGQG